MIRLPACAGAVTADSFSGNWLNRKSTKARDFGRPDVRPLPSLTRNTRAFSTSESFRGRVSSVLLLGLAVLPDHRLNFSRCPTLRFAGQRLLIVKSGIHQPLIAFCQYRKRGNQILIVKASVSSRCFRKRIRQAHEQMFFFVHELVRDFHLKKQSGRIDLVRRSRPLMLPRLQKIGAIARTVERDFALFAATLRADPPVNSGAKSFLLADFTNSAAQSELLASIMSSRLTIRLLRSRVMAAIADCRIKISG